MVSSNSKSTNQTARQIFKILLTNLSVSTNLKISWVKAHAVNERADQLEKDATQHGQPYSHTKLPKPHIRGLLRNSMREEEDVIFSQHGPFPAYLRRFHLSDSDHCSCGGIGTALHYATECILTVSWHMRKPVPNFEQEWLKRVANNLVYGIKFLGLSNS
ncbi:hypothetical protein AVEN_273201-1 [Araneus ventricosus]|uniref:RNase H type-1 domain-containing protein n=1 Tax=Araneus ventricosus TaxID=182803 RepID=A0A4Y2GR58_ARAVE|nr:hypothetical protein AVEN_273201-1 [Araneus ventricosus]